MGQLLHFEKLMWKRGYTHIAGLDEAGRGPLAGPVVAAACIFPKNIQIDGVNDSKKLTRKKRQALYTQITQVAQYGIGIVDHTTIDQINIYQATIRACTEALKDLHPDYILVDGRLKLPINTPYECIPKGDARSHCIAAASILAKETRDRIMEEYHLEYPNYGFSQHKGYGTAAHLEAIKQWGRCPIHRLSFRAHSLSQSNTSGS